ncbi:tyrosine-type recombinase/integrase [Kitasatospora purpeofusca]|uniref:tyrosine-type recombinase/integrase n=1 Tax=Kitasatospora purpeofusca TaxID=67352 RepID=UPI0035DC48B9
MVEPRLRVIEGRTVPEMPVTWDPWEFQALCVEAFVASWRARGFSPVTVDNDIGLLERTLKALGRPAWDVTPEDIDRVVGGLAVEGRAPSTRRGYVQIFKGFHRFLQARKAAEIEAAFGVRLVCPVDEFNASRHVGDDSPAMLPPPTPERVEEFFDFLKTRIATARKYAPAARDYALFRTLYHAGLRSEEASLLDRPDVHFGRGPFGKLHVRFGKGAHTSGPRPRWVPMLDQLDLVLRWFLDDVRGMAGRPLPGNFVRWALSQRIARDLSFPAVRWNGPSRPMDDEARWATARRLLHDDTIRTEDRLAGLLLLLYAQWPAAISRLTIDHIEQTDGAVRIRLGEVPVELPELVADLAVQQVAARRSHAVLARSDSPWLFPGGQPGRPISVWAMGERLRKLGIRLAETRSTALFQLATELPAAVLARTLGIDITVAVKWQRAAAGDWGAYAAEIASRASHSGGRGSDPGPR